MTPVEPDGPGAFMSSSSLCAKASASTVHGQPRERDIDARPGSPSDLRRLPPSYSFAARCSRRTADCRGSVPELRFPERGHMAACFAVADAAQPPS
jgi:peptide/nickel transport system ATP-binding protein